MKLGVLFSGGKDSTYAAWLAKIEGHELTCLISVYSENKNSFMFHTPTIELTKKQAECMKIPLIVQKTKGNKEEELDDLEEVIKRAIEEYHIKGVATGAIASVYQASRIQKICDKLNIFCINPLWQKDQIELLNELISEGFEVRISAVAAYPLDKSWVGRIINSEFIKDVIDLKENYKINPAGEGGEFESLVVNCPLFKNKLDVKLEGVIGSGNSWGGSFSSV